MEAVFAQLQSKTVMLDCIEAKPNNNQSSR